MTAILAFLRIVPWRVWPYVAILLVVAGLSFSIWRDIQAGRAAQERVEQLERTIRAREALDAALEANREEAAQTQEAVRALPRRELTPDEEAIARRIFQ